MHNLKRRDFLTLLKAALVVSLVLSYSSCVYAEADFSYLDFNQTKSIKLVNPLYLDNSKIERPVIKLTTPYSGEFSESDYFSSEINDTSASEETLTPLREAKQEIKPNKDSPPQENSNSPPEEILDFSRTVNQNSPPNEEVHDFFTPPIQPSELMNEPDEVYSAGVDTDEEVDLNGKTISNIQIAGLNLLQKDSIKSNMRTQIGSLFNEELIQQDLQRIYATGFFTDRMSVEPILKSDGSVELVFSLQENIPVTDVSIVGNTVISTMELLPFVMPLKGLPQNISKINSSIEKVSEYYHNKGYILASVSSVDDDADGNLAFTVSEGIIDKIVIEGNEKTKDYVIERNIMTQSGTVYNENYLKEDISRLYSTKIFKDVDRKILPSEDKDGEYNVVVMVKEDSSNSLAIGGGIDNALGAFGSLSYNENNFLGRGQKLTASGILGSGILLSDASIKNRVNYQLELNFFEPYLINADNSLTGKLYYRDLGSWQVPLAIERRFGVNAGVEHKVKGYDNLTTTFNAGVEHISLSEGDFSRISELYSMRNLDISRRAQQLSGGTFFNLAPGVRYSTLDSDENPRKGIVAKANYLESFGVNKFNRTNGRLAGSVTKYFPVRSKSSLALSAKAGIKVHGNDMPEVMAFSLGGPYSIRGFRMNGVGSGDGFLMGSAELATPLPFVDRLKWDFFQKMRLTFFVDAGKVYDPTISNVLFDRPGSAISAGIGLKVFVPGVGPISVDYGIPLTNPGHYGSKNGYFTFGTGDMNYW